MGLDLIVVLTSYNCFDFNLYAGQVSVLIKNTLFNCLAHLEGAKNDPKIIGADNGCGVNGDLAGDSGDASRRYQELYA